MNLIDLFTRKDGRFGAPDDTVISRRNWGGESWRCLSLTVNDAPLRLSGFADTHPYWARPDQTGWYATLAPGKVGAATLEVAIRRGAEVLSRREVAVGPEPSPVFVPWPVPPVPLGAGATLELTFRGDAERVEILVHRALRRQVLYDLAQGNGVEIGPGPRPQILPSDTVTVTYIEETSPEEWARLYDRKGNFGAAEADWSNIQVGKAAALPVEDDSLDFIFSSHVFEHLSNPLGHLERWRAKMRPGGVVMAVVPDLTSTKDRFMRPCAPAEFLDEYESKSFEPLERHYHRYVKRLTSGKDDPALARTLMGRNESIHIHFYDRATIAWLLSEAVARFGYTAFHLEHARNHKDFHFVLQA